MLTRSGGKFIRKGIYYGFRILNRRRWYKMYRSINHIIQKSFIPRNITTQLISFVHWILQVRIYSFNLLVISRARGKAILCFSKPRKHKEQTTFWAQKVCILAYFWALKLMFWFAYLRAKKSNRGLVPMFISF